MRKKERKTPQNCKSPMQRQRLMTTIKNVTEDKKTKSLIGFLSANKIDNYSRAGRGKGGKKRKNPKESTKQIKT